MSERFESFTRYEGGAMTAAGIGAIVGAVALENHIDAEHFAAVSHIDHLEDNVHSLRRSEHLIVHNKNMDGLTKLLGQQTFSGLLAQNKKELGVASHNVPGQLSNIENAGIEVGMLSLAVIAAGAITTRIRRAVHDRKATQQAKIA